MTSKQLPRISEFYLFNPFKMACLNIKADLYGVADKEVLAVRLILAGVCIVVRTVYGEKEWIKRSIKWN